MTKCFWYGHDFVTIEKFFTAECVCPKTIRVCIKCKKIFDTITPYKNWLRKEKESKESRIDKAKRIYSNRYNPND